MRALVAVLLAISALTTVARGDATALNHFTCEASYYSWPEHGRPTAWWRNGKPVTIFDSTKLTCATARALRIPFGTVLRVVEVTSGAEVEVTNTDAMSDSVVRVHPSRWLDLSAAAFEKIARKSRGVVTVEVHGPVPAPQAQVGRSQYGRTGWSRSRQKKEVSQTYAGTSGLNLGQLWSPFKRRVRVTYCALMGCKKRPTAPLGAAR